MFFMIPMLPVLALYVAAAVLPAIFLLRYIYRNDTVEKEPAGLLVSLLLVGVLSALCAAIVEGVAGTILNALVPEGTRLHTILLAFVVVAAVEEGAKFLMLRRRTWWNPNFNYRFDGIVYAVFVSLGFAAFENIQYVFRYGLSVALPRALFAVPGHMCFAIFMGLFYGRAKLLDGLGDWRGARREQRTGYLLAVFFHGFYDACAMMGTARATGVFLVFVVLMYLLVFRLVRRESATDAPV